MRPFWNIAIEPLLEAVRPDRILEIGVDQGLTTKLLLAYVEDRGAFIEAIDPNPKIDTDAWERDHPGLVRFHRGLSLEVIPDLEPVDAALVDGDHNWYTVRNELELLEQIAIAADTAPPVIIIHDTAWPYARRDLYYAAETIPEEHIHPHQRAGLVRGRPELAEDGFNSHLDHATTEGGKHNGVLTAIEDFIAEAETDWDLSLLPGANGLGILVPAARLEDEGRLRDILEQFEQRDFLHSLVEEVEGNRLDSETRRQRAARQLSEAVAEHDADRRAAAPSEPPRASERELERLERRLDEEHDRRARVEQDLLARSQEKAEAEGRISAHQREIELLQTALADAQRLAGSSTQELYAARAELEEREHTNRRAQRQREDLEEQIGEAKRALAEEGKRLREVSDARDAADQQVAAFERAVAEHERGATEARRSAEALELERQELKLELAARDREIATLAAARGALTSDFEDMRETLQQALDEARAQADTARVLARELRERLEVREVESHEIGEDLRETREALAAARAQAEVASAKRAALEAQLAAVKAEEPAPTAPRDDSGPEPAAVEPAVEPQQAVSAPAPLVVPAPPARASEPELAARAYFTTAYRPDPAPPGSPSVDPVALPAAHDLRGMLVAEHEPGGVAPTIDVIVCVHNALDDVRLCLWSILQKSDRPLRLVLVNDGSDHETTEYLRSVAARESSVRLVENLQEPHGYTIAANLGLRAATGDYLVLLNSDTVVTHGWLDRIVACGESDPQIGIVGPLSNAASHQSIPELRDRRGWATNPLPAFATADGIGCLLARIGPPRRPRFSFINGFCFVIKRAVVEAIGYFDEEHFASGYCEESDYCLRASDAGFALAVADDGYVFHAKSKSFTPKGRKLLAKRNYEILLEKHGRERMQTLVRAQESDPALAPLRNAASDALSSPASLASALDSSHHAPLRIRFVLPGMSTGGSGGSHSIYQEVRGLRNLGLDAKIALSATAMPKAHHAYEDAGEIFEPFRDVSELAELTFDADVIAATHFKSATLVAQLRARRTDFLPAYYVQDYEPFFTSKAATDLDEAIASYTLIPDCLLFAKTHWLCNIVSSRHGLYVAKVEPSIDERLFRTSREAGTSGRVRIAAMIRPRTPRRQPTATIAALERLCDQFGATVRVTTFGCSHRELEGFTGHPGIVDYHRGLLSRAEVAELLEETDVFLDMSLYQAFGRTALEAMACGCTAVVPRLGGVWEFVEQRKNAIAVDTLDKDAAVNALAELIEDGEMLKSLQTRARETASRYTILRAALSEYLVFVREHQLSFGAGLGTHRRPTGAANS